MDSPINSGNNNEVVYGTSESPIGDDNRVMSEKVQQLASSIYREFEFMIQKHGNEGVKNLMPLVVNVLETLDLTLLERDEQTADIEILKEDNDQLLNMFEREKVARRQAEQKYIEIEDNMIGDKKELENKIDSLESIMRMLELKAKNSSDHASRLEEREAEQKSEFDRLHERYNTLLRTHVDHMERTKYLMGNDKFELMQNMPIPQTQLRTRMGMAASVDASNIRGVSDLISAHMTQSTTMDVNLANHISEGDWQDEFPSDIEQSPRDLSSDVESTSARESGPIDDVETTPIKRHAEAGEVKEGQSMEGEHEDTLGADLTGNLVDPAEFASADDDDIFLSRHRSRTTSMESTSDLVNDTFIGMGREVENLIKENTELMDMKNALNIVKNDLIARVDELSSENEILKDEVRSLEMVRIKMTDSIEHLEKELKETKQRLVEKEAEMEEEDVPMAQRKRFTRSEMQRVLIDRNMYKEKLMELEESLKWTEMQRVRKLQQQQNPPQKKGGGIWDFFSGLFGESPSPTNPRRAGSRADSRKAMTRSVEYLDPDMISERRAAERREQYKLVREHVKSDSGRIEAYGWSLAAVDSNVPSCPMVPVPVCCRPLLENQPTLKVWCSTGVVLRGGKNSSGAYITGDPVYFSPCAKKVPKPEGHELESEITRARALDARESELSEWESSSLIWVGSSNQGKSLVAILDANNPNMVIDTFDACDSHLLCMLGVPGVVAEDTYIDDVSAKKYISGGGRLKDIPEGLDGREELGACEWIELRKLEDSEDGVPTFCSNDMKPSPRRSRDFSICEQPLAGPAEKPAKPQMAQVDEAEEAVEELPNTHLIPLEKMKDIKVAVPSPAAGQSRVGRAALPPHIRDAMSKYDDVSDQMSTVLPTVWMGSQNQYLYIHSAVTAWKQCQRRIKLPDAVLSLVHYKARVFAALANGSIAVFHRDKTGAWSEAGYHSIRIGKATSSVRSLCVVAGNIWAAYKNCVAVLDAETLHVVKVFTAHPRKDSQVRNMQWVGAGVWISIRLDSSLRLFHAHTFQHLQDVDIEPFVTKMLGTSRLDFSYMRTTSLLVSNRRLWIGTGTGVVISVPLSETIDEKIETSDQKRPAVPGSVVRVSKTSSAAAKVTGDYIPYCNLSQAQLSFHGHKDSVKFFLAVPGAPPSRANDGEDSEAEIRKMLIVSGGDGYIDFRMGEEHERDQSGKDHVPVRDMSHLIIWELDADLPVLTK